MRKNKRKGKNMADTNENKVLDSENKTLDEKQTAPVAAKLTDTAEIISPGKQAQSETLDKDHDENATPLEADALLVPYTAGGRKEQIVAQDTAVQAPAADDKLKKEQKELLKSLDSKADDFAKKNPAPKKKDAPAKAKAEKPPKAPKEKKTANIGGGGIGGTGGKSEQTATKEAAPVVPEPPRDAKRPGGKETIVYIDHADLHPFKNHPFQVRDDDANQRHLLQDVAMKLDLNNTREYIDDGITGTRRDRENFQRMIADIEKGEVGTVVVKDLSRLARDHIQADTLIEEVFPEYDVRLIAPGDGVDTSKGEDEIIPFRNLMNEFYARDISKKRKATNFVKGNMGISLSRPPYGYMYDPNDPKRWVIDEEPAEVVRRIYNMYLNGQGIEQIAAEISKDGILTPVCYLASKGQKAGGKRNADTDPTRWGHGTVGKILALQEYCGDVINFKTYSKSFKLKKRIKNAEEDMKIFKDVHDPVIERSMWDKVQSKRGSTRKRTTRTSSEGAKNIFSGFLICPDCGGNLNFHYNQGNKDITYFNCKNNNKSRKTCPTTHYIRVDFLEQIILREIQRLTVYAEQYEDEFIKLVTGFVNQVGESDYKRKEKELATRTNRNKEIDKLFERLYEDNISGKINDERYYRMSANYAGVIIGISPRKPLIAGVSPT